MAVQTNDIGILFASMRSIYGHLWPHGASDVEVWRRALNEFSAAELQLGANKCLREFPDRPPTMGQFVFMLSSGRPPPARRIEKPKFSLVRAQANRILMVMLFRADGFPRDTLKAMVELKNALAEDAEREQTDELVFAAELDTALRQLMKDHKGEPA